MVNVRNYGATADGITDNTAAINSAIVAFTGSKTVRVWGNIYKKCRNSFDNYIGIESYNDADNVIVP